MQTKPMKLPKYAEKKFAHYLREMERSDATVEKYLHDLRCFISFVNKDTYHVPKDNIVTKQKVLSYKKHLAENYAVTSANSMIAALNCFFRLCGRDDMCVKQYRVQRKIYCSEEKELSKAEYLRLLKAAKDQENEQIGLIVQTICGTGIRVSELKYITVEAAENEEAVVRCKGKNRRVFIVPELKKKLLRYSKKHGIRSGTIFKTKHGKDISRNSVWKAMKKLCKKANVAPSKVFPHNLRHLFARTFYGIEKDIAKLSDILGHTSIDTTRIYIITTGAEHRRKMENMRLVI